MMDEYINDSSSFLFSDSDSDDFVLPSQPSSSSDSEDCHANTSKRKKTKLRFSFSKRRRLTFPEVRPNTDEKKSEDIPTQNNMGGESTVNLSLEEILPDQSNLEIDERQPTVDNENLNAVKATPKKMYRKIVSKPEAWKCNVRKKFHQSGKAYISRRGKSVPEKEIKNLKNCIKDCKYKCQEKISVDEPLEIYESYYSLQSATEKRHFLLSNTKRTLTVRPLNKALDSDELDIESAVEDVDESDDSAKTRAKTSKPKSRRKFTFKYFFSVNGEQIQVCKLFFLGTLSISQKPVYTAHNTKNALTNTPAADQRGKSVNSRRLPTGDPEFVRDHIASFPKVESHYCRAKTSKEYLGSHLSIAKMYDLYIEKCASENIVPVKKSLYYKIFTTEFNLDFHSPKSDRCDTCEKFTMANKTETVTESLENEYNWHVVYKTAMRKLRKLEKENDLPVLLFDLQNVITVPHAEISSLFYFRKLNVYNLTAYYTVTKQVYCAIWPETMSGRSGNDIASAFRRILDAVVEENDVSELTTWSDSCVPQNRNSIISNAVLDFIRDNPTIDSVKMNFSLPGHSCVQEVDSAHSSIEREMNKQEFYSPIGLVRILKQVSRHRPYRIIQMKPTDFKNFAGTAKLLNYKVIPYKNVASLKFTRTLHTVYFKTSHDPYEPENSKAIKFTDPPQRKCKKLSPSSNTESYVNVLLVKPKIQNQSTELSDLKKKDIKAAYPFMPLQDRQYYSALLKI